MFRQFKEKNKNLLLMAMQVPQESAENKYLGHRMLFTLANQHSHRRKALITKIL
jgi:hypothetical protein